MIAFPFLSIVLDGQRWDGDLHHLSPSKEVTPDNVILSLTTFIWCFYFLYDRFSRVCVLKLEIVSTSILNMFILYNQRTHDAVDALAESASGSALDSPPE